MSNTVELHPGLAAADLAVTILLAILINVALYPFTPSYAGPLTAVAILATTTALLRMRGQSWRDLGLCRRHSTPAIVGLALLVLVGTVLAGGLAELLGRAILAPPIAEARVDRFGEVEGNLARFLALVAMGWVVGGFAEEMVFRGFCLSRFEALLTRGLGPGRVTTSLAVIAQAALFGAVHFYNRGLAGGLTITVVGISFGAFYLLARRSLWPGILAHGLVDTLGFLEDYLGV